MRKAIQLTPAHRAYVDSGWPNTNSNNGGDQSAITAIGNAGTAVGNMFFGYTTYFNAGTLRTWLSFNLTNIPNTATINSVRLNMYVFGASSNDYADSTFYLYRSTGSFNEDNITWNNAPNASLVASSSATWVDPEDTSQTAAEWANSLNPWIVTIPTTDISSALADGEVVYRIHNDENATWALPGDTAYRLDIVYTENVSTAAKLYHDGQLNTYETVDERLPAVLNGLMYHYPLDYTDESTGTWNKNGNYGTTGTTSIQDIAHSYLPALEQGTKLKFTGWFKKSSDFVNNVSYFNYFQLDGVWKYYNVGYFQSEIGTDWTYIEKNMTVNSAGGKITNGRQGVTVRNGSNYGTIEWRDCELHISASVNTNPQYSFLGLGMFDATTNLVDLSSYASNDVDVTDNVLIPYLSGNEVKKISTNTLTNPYIRWSLGSDTTSGLIYSAHVKVYDPNNVISTHLFKNTISDFTGLVSGSIQLENGWKTLWASGTSSYTGTGSSLSIFSKASFEGETYWASEPMVEQKSKPTEFVDGTRSLGVFAVTGSISVDSGSIAFKYNVKRPTENFPTIMNLGWYTAPPYTDDGIAFYRGQGWSSGNTISFGMWSSASNQTAGTSITINDERENHTLYFATTWDTSTNILRARIHDLTTNELLMNYNNTNFTAVFTEWDTPLYLGSLDGGTHEQGWYRDLSVYNRALSVQELGKLVSSSLQIEQTITVVDEEVREHPRFPTGSYYFPLMYYSSSIYNDILPSEVTNDVYETDRGIFVGQYTTNLLDTNYRDLSSTTDIQSNSTKTLIDTGKYRWVNDGTGTSTIRSYCLLASLTSGTPYNCNIKYQDLQGRIQMDWCDVTTNLTGSYVADGNIPYGKLSLTSARTTYDSTYRFMDIKLDPGTSVTLFEPQVQIQQFETPYVNGTRTIQSLEFNLSQSIDMDWSGNWSIVYWKYPTGTHLSNGLNGYSIESLGCNASTGQQIGGGYTWWGKNTGANTLASFTPSAIDPDNYFRNWQMVSLVKNGTTLTIRIRGIKGNENAVRTQTLSGIPSNYFVTGYGYDFKLGGWDNSNSNNAYFRDLVIAKYAYTDSQLDDIYTQMKIRLNDGIYIKNLTEEGI